jgi:hypothetical protein
MTETSTETPRQNHISGKAARIEKLLNFKTLKLHGDAYKEKYELNAQSAEEYIQKNLQGTLTEKKYFTNKDTGEKFAIGKLGRQKVTYHSRGNIAHLKAIAHIPFLIENSIFIDEAKPKDEMKSK